MTTTWVGETEISQSPEADWTETGRVVRRRVRTAATVNLSWAWERETTGHDDAYSLYSGT